MIEELFKENRALAVKMWIKLKLKYLTSGAFISEEVLPMVEKLKKRLNVSREEENAALDY